MYRVTVSYTVRSEKSGKTKHTVDDVWLSQEDTIERARVDVITNVKIANILELLEPVTVQIEQECFQEIVRCHTCEGRGYLPTLFVGRYTCPDCGGEKYMLADNEDGESTTTR